MLNRRTQGVQKQLTTLVGFFDTFQPIINSHFAELFTDDLWNKNVPKAIRDELHSTELLNEFIEAFPKLINDEHVPELCEKFRNVSNFIRTSNGISIRKDKSCLLSLANLENHLLKLNDMKECNLEIDKFMSKKKQHEVQVISKYIAMLKNMTKTSHVVDIGGGKGYLSSTLVLQYNCKVIGLDASQITTCGASKLSQSIACEWGTFQPNEKSCESESAQNKKKNLRQYYQKLIEENYRQATEYVTSNTDIVKLVERNFSEPCLSICLVGLHTCGELSPTSIRFFIKNDVIKSMVNVGCCYHFLREEFSDKFWKSFEVNVDECGFPMSEFLKKKKFFMGRNAMMLCQHSIDKYSATFPDSKSENSERSLLHRAILEVIIRKNNRCKEGFVTRLAKRHQNFHDYIRKALLKLELDIEMSDEELTRIYDHYLKQLPLLRAFFLIRVNLAPVIESIILLDRLLYLLENGMENSFLVPFFDRSISPRGFGLIAWR